MRITEYTRAPVALRPWDALAPEIVEGLRLELRQRGHELSVEHIGSTAVPGLLGKGIVDAMIVVDAADVAQVVRMLNLLGLQSQPKGRGFPPWRPLLLCDVEFEGQRFSMHVHVIPADSDEVLAQRGFVGALRKSRTLRASYAETKQRVVEAGVTDPGDYSTEKIGWVLGALEENGITMLPDPQGDPPPSVVQLLAGRSADDP